MLQRARHTRIRFLAAAASAILLGTLAVPAASASTSAGSMPEWVAGAAQSDEVLAAVERHADKLSAEFVERLRYAQPDGTLRVMVALGGRSSAVDDFVEANTAALKWYSASPSFYGTVTPAQLANLLEASFVRFVEPDYPITYSLAASVPDVAARGTAGDPGVWSFDPTDGPMGTLESDVAGLSVDQATGKGVTVAVVDSGIDKTHRDFGGWDCAAGAFSPCESRVSRTVTAEHLVGPGFDFGDEAPTTDLVSGHGTHVAGIVGGNGYYVRDYAVADPTFLEPEIYGGDGFPIGVAPQATLMNVKNGDSQWAGLGTLGLDWLADNAREYGVRVANNSWGCVGGCSFNGNSATAQIFKALYDEGVVVTFAGGNDNGSDNGSAYNGNAQSPYVLGVASYSAATHQLAASSSRGSATADLPDPATWTPESEPVNGHRRPDLAAPGVSIWSARSLTGGTSSLVPRQNSADVTGGLGCCIREYATMGGTSMAAPHVAGAAALLFSACPDASTLDAMRALMVGADADRVLKTGSTTEVAQPFEVGYGGLDVRAGIDWLLSRPVCGGSGPVNSDPVATDDSLSLNQGEAGTVDVLANDSDPDGDELSVIEIGAVASGRAELTEAGITYTPRADFHGIDSFDYVVGDGRGGTDIGTVTVTVNGAPLAVEDSVQTKKKRAVRFDVFANDSDPEGDVFTLTSTTQPTQGTVDCAFSGTCSYIPEDKFKGVDTFTYATCDTHGACSEGTVTIKVG